MGRFSKLTDEQKAIVRQRAAEGENKTKLAGAYEISRATLYSILNAA